jgi:RNA polymerase sigma-70 factor, ECF subfamily
MHDGDGAEADLVERIAAGETDALGELFVHFQPRLFRLIGLRMAPQLRGRLDAADVLQEAWLDIDRRFPEWLAKREMPLFLWVRFLTVQKLAELHRRNGAQVRDAGREVPMHAGPEASVGSLAQHLAGSFTSPSQGLARAELVEQVQAALNDLAELDREVLVMRHFEELSNNEVAAILGITKAGASNRYMRALKRLRVALEGKAGA